MPLSCRLLSVILLLSSSLLLHVSSSLAAIVCDDLPNDVCAFSIASSGKRCVLEKVNEDDEQSVYQCKTSEVEFERMSGHVEKEKCIEACGVDRKSIGMSSSGKGTLLDNPQFLSKLCSPDCHKNCLNIVDFYFNMAAGEGSYLPDLCQKKSTPTPVMREECGVGHGRGMLGQHCSNGAADSSPDSSPSPAPYP